jgi:diguanylate cyclase (GGDEF)-like protein
MMWFRSSVFFPVQRVFGSHVPARLQAIYSEMSGLASRLNAPTCQVEASEVGLLHRAALHYRSNLARQQETFHASNVDAKHANAIDAITNEVDHDLAQQWLRDVAPTPRPRLTEFVNLRTARAILLKQDVPLPESLTRAYDEKFGILWSPAQIQHVLEATRNEGWLLGTETCVAFIDIDNFKGVNTALTETRVDREVLPPLMLLLEALTSSRGYAFRQGGDEYVVVLPNADQVEGAAFLNKLCAAIGRRLFGEQRVTVSIGFFVAPEDCYLTNGELLSRANQAKNTAKSAGKNCVRAYE